MSAHSPLPWYQGRDPRIVDATGEPVGEVYAREGDPPRKWSANAALIVRAVNHFDALMALVSDIANNDQANSKLTEYEIDIRHDARELLTRIEAK